MEHMNQENISQEENIQETPEQQSPKFSVGIDLGTTHCVMSLSILTMKMLV